MANVDADLADVGADFAEAVGNDFAEAVGVDFAEAGVDFADAVGADFAESLGADFAEAGADFTEADIETAAPVGENVPDDAAKAAPDAAVAAEPSSASISLRRAMQAFSFSQSLKRAAEEKEAQPAKSLVELAKKRPPWVKASLSNRDKAQATAQRPKFHSKPSDAQSRALVEKRLFRGVPDKPQTPCTFAPHVNAKSRLKAAARPSRQEGVEWWNRLGKQPEGEARTFSMTRDAFARGGYSINTESGVVREVESSGPAADAGMSSEHVGWQIVRIDGKGVTADNVSRALAETKQPGRTFTATLRKQATHASRITTWQQPPHYHSLDAPSQYTVRTSAPITAAAFPAYKSIEAEVVMLRPPQGGHFKSGPFRDTKHSPYGPFREAFVGLHSPMAGDDDSLFKPQPGAHLFKKAANRPVDAEPDKGTVDVTFTMVDPAEADRVRAVARDAFKRADGDHDDSLGHEELREYLSQKAGMDDSTIDAMFDACDTSHDGKLSRDEFTKLIEDLEAKEAAEKEAAVVEDAENEESPAAKKKKKKFDDINVHGFNLNSMKENLMDMFSAVEPVTVTMTKTSLLIDVTMTFNDASTAQECADSIEGKSNEEFNTGLGVKISNVSAPLVGREKWWHRLNRVKEKEKPEEQEKEEIPEWNRLDKVEGEGKFKLDLGFFHKFGPVPLLANEDSPECTFSPKTDKKKVVADDKVWEGRWDGFAEGLNNMPPKVDSNRNPESSPPADASANEALAEEEAPGEAEANAVEEAASAKAAAAHKVQEEAEAKAQQAAALKIQAVSRGQLGRKEVAEIAGADLSNEFAAADVDGDGVVSSAEAEKAAAKAEEDAAAAKEAAEAADKEVQEAHAAAAKIQAMRRGQLVRREQKKDEW